jgi:hypothetical protein
MNPRELARFREIEEIFYAAIEQPPGDARDMLIGQRCGADENLRSEVTLLLEDHERIKAATPPSVRRLPRFGAWQAVKLLGRGGMGTVYLAERADGAFQMSAAVKVVPLALASHEIEDRFRRERQFLASLDHPKVARLIDGGVSETGLPYLVMEFVAGLTIDRFCDTHELDVRGRIGMMRQVLEALAYVHGRNVIHRDVKPSNILVDNSGNVKLLDFGTARLMDATADTAPTKTGVFAFTPEYASPEQVRGEPVAAASDLYSAGVLLYRLLTGRLPYRIADPSPAGVARAISRRRPEPSHLDVPLDAMLAKAMRKDAAGRYQSAAEMDDDLARYLEGGRVRAQKPRARLWAALAAILSVGGATWLLRYPGREPFHTTELGPFDAGVPNAMEPALSSDGKWLAFASPGDAGTRPDIWLKRMPNGIAKRVTGGNSANDEPALSPDGQWLAFHSTRQPAGIYIQPAMAAASGTVRLLVEGGWLPRYSPDGKWIAYLSASDNAGDPEASGASKLYRVPAQGGERVQLARNASSVQGSAWNADSEHVFFLALDDENALRLWRAPLNGEPATLIPEFSDPLRLNARACALAGDRLLYFGMSPVLGDFRIAPALPAARYASATAPSQMDIYGCSASAGGIILADAVDSLSSSWALPIDADTGAVRGSLTQLTEPASGVLSIQLAPDGGSFFTMPQSGQPFLQDYRTRSRSTLPGVILLSSDGLFILHTAQVITANSPPIVSVVNLKTRQSWGWMQGGGLYWDLSRGGQWLLTASIQVHRTITAWDTRTAEHRVIYAHPSANLYLANFSKDGRWAVFVSQESSTPPHMWAAPFRGLRDVPATDWVDLGEGDYPRWSPGGGRIYFTQVHDGFECIFMRAVDPVSKRPTGPVMAVQHFHGRLTPQGLRPGTFRLSVASDKIGFALGERTHRLFEWQ